MRVGVDVGLGRGLAEGDRRQQALLLGFGRGVHDRRRGQQGGGEIGRAEQGPAHLLEHDAELDEAETLAAEFLGLLAFRLDRFPSRVAAMSALAAGSLDDLVGGD